MLWLAGTLLCAQLVPDLQLAAVNACCSMLVLQPCTCLALAACLSCYVAHDNWGEMACCSTPGAVSAVCSPSCGCAQHAQAAVALRSGSSSVDMLPAQQQDVTGLAVHCNMGSAVKLGTNIADPQPPVCCLHASSQTLLVQELSKLSSSELLGSGRGSAPWIVNPDDLEWCLNAEGNPIVLGRGGFGEVRRWPTVILCTHIARCSYRWWLCLDAQHSLQPAVT